MLKRKGSESQNNLPKNTAKLEASHINAKIKSKSSYISQTYYS